MKQTTQTEKVVAVRAAQSKIEGNSKLFFLFTAGQVEEVLSEIVMRPVPFAPSFLQGVTLWRGRLLPVVDLEKRFSFSHGEKREKSRFLVVRTGAPENPDGEQILRCALRLSSEIHSVAASGSSSMVDCERIGVEPSLVRGIYQWNEDMYVVPDLVSILQNQQTLVSTS
jgi:chemotaxis signal transduction protein